ncbi:MazG-like family protein [Streptomyces sp. SudanB182_2057]|uniref:MazG-like family protein n=1 Tax=Streptomyces sp. SudanB182_2057 TaxID=3035281 RepID=UPI003F56D241
MSIPEGHLPSDAPPWDDIGRLAALFTSLDTGRGMTPEQQWTLQALKISEEAGETAQAVIGAWGTNPRKGQSHTWRHVQEEVADTAITSLVALYRMLGEEAPAFFAAVLAEKSAKFLAFEAAGDQRHEAPGAPTADPREGR